MHIPTFQKNRECLSVKSLRQYADMWVAFHADGCCVVASGRTYEELEADMAKKNLNPEELGIEQIEFDDVSMGGAELS